MKEETKKYMDGGFIVLFLLLMFFLGMKIGADSRKETMCAHIKYELKVESRLCTEGK